MLEPNVIHDGHPVKIDPDDLPWLQIQDGGEVQTCYYVNPELGHWSIYQRAESGTVLPYLMP